MIEIPLTQGKAALIDECDAHLTEWKWCAAKTHNSGLYYAVRKFALGKCRQGTIYLHHAILGQPLNGRVADHRNGNGLDNRRSNLRLVSVQENNRNNKARRTGKTASLFVGVYASKFGRWKAMATIDGRLRYFGNFATQEEAHAAYKRAAGDK